jgi:PASTA domain
VRDREEVTRITGGGNIPSDEHVAEMLTRVRHRGHQLQLRRQWVLSTTGAFLLFAVVGVPLFLAQQATESGASTIPLPGPQPCPENYSPTPPGAIAWPTLYVPITHVGQYDIKTATKDVPFFVQETLGGGWCINGGYAKLSKLPGGRTIGAQPGSGEIFPGPVSFEVTFDVTRLSGNPFFVYTAETLVGVNRTVPPVTVPDVVGMDLAAETGDAIRTLWTSGLTNSIVPNTGIVTSSQCNVGLGSNIVVRQSPAPGTNLPAGSPVTLYVSLPPGC